MKEKAAEFCTKTLGILRHKKLGIAEFEEAAGLSIGALSRYAKDGNIRLANALKIAENLDCTIPDILAFDEREAARRRKQEKIDSLRAQIAQLEKEMED